MTGRPLVLLLALVAVAGCATPRRDSSLRATLADGDWRLVVDQSLASAPGGLPSDAIPDSAYHSEAAGVEYRIRVGPRAERIEVIESRVRGSLIAEQPDRLEYDLVEGAFAGGRFVVRRDGAGFRAEITLYGSGVPIVSSQRGWLTKVG